MTSKFIVMAQHASDVAVGVKSKFIVRAHHVSNSAVGVTSVYCEDATCFRFIGRCDG